MFTGLPPSLHGATRWKKLSTGVPYLPELLAAGGYQVDGVVTGAFLSQSFGLERGFHVYRFFDNPGASKAVDAALELVRLAQGRSQFLFLHLFDPHWPYVPPRDLIEHFGPRPEDISGLLENISDLDRPPRDPEEIQQVVNLYDAQILATDRELGRFIDELKSEGLYDSALIILTGDHGEAFHEHGLWQHSVTVYEEMIRIPLIVKWPGNTPRGRDETPAHHVDVFPTVLEEAGLDIPANRGSRLRELLGIEGAREESRDLISETTWMSAGRMFMKISLRDGNLKYIMNMEDEADKGWPPTRLTREELYDLSEDPGELDDLSPQTPERLGPFRRRLRAYLAEAQKRREMQPGGEVVLDETMLERLKALGYIDRE
jgi:arylsulfatase A-like enzyme